MATSAHWLAVGPLILALVLTAIERYRGYDADRMLRARLRALSEPPAPESNRQAGGTAFVRRPVVRPARFGRRPALQVVATRPVIEGSAVRLVA